jgi:hypothetical protein
MKRSLKVALFLVVVGILTSAPVRAEEDAIDRPTAPPKNIPAQQPSATATATPSATPAAKKPAKKKKVKWTEQELQLAPAPLMKPKP